MVNKAENKIVLDSITWSFSSVNCYATCPHMFYLQYIQCVAREDNAFAQWGSFGHSLLERYYKGEAEFFELASIYEQEYKKHVTCRFPFNKYAILNRTYSDAGLDYFQNFEGDFSDCEVLGVEQEIRITVGGYPFVGYIDLILRDRTDGGIILCDHKSKSKFKNRAERAAYLHQLYLYAIYIRQKYGTYPKKLVFNMFRSQAMVEEAFDSLALQQAEAWFAGTIEVIYADTAFSPKPDKFFCDNLCGARKFCSCSRYYSHRLAEGGGAE